MHMNQSYVNKADSIKVYIKELVHKVTNTQIQKHKYTNEKNWANKSFN